MNLSLNFNSPIDLNSLWFTFLISKKCQLPATLNVLAVDLFSLEAALITDTTQMAQNLPYNLFLITVSSFSLLFSFSMAFRFSSLYAVIEKHLFTKGTTRVA